ncbi:PREDICTED: 5'-3' exoribonuclease 1-like [Rhagoletis zephyria]|uniref:5'-3' exoribonuclease 1-like n=1 Tax=Rhagoletis zephyria TaxID=28612 RepID=UPI000811985F|nr:PREDICTED: 5'-3' exoribonuclease 1-like [Rhagoletis zephyria]
MGVPKFYRWLSERYPCINENVNQSNMPEFDNFYVDMNGVFHICSHPSDDVHFRLTEAQIFENIGVYVEFLFNLVQPKKVFFLSVDGVAPRSKMNQQRSRRYRTAKEAIEKEEKAKRLGETLPTDPRFDSNCITPGTEFMGKLHDYMVAFLKQKVQANASWREVEVIYSGYDVPGEGEHKIMDYVRFSKTKAATTAKTVVRHCLYGLDADLINLGLSCHEPYFSLLREEVNFNKNAKRHCDPFKTNFQLLHLSILRDYLNMEFVDLKPRLSFEYSLENIIDDWILMNFLIGNDFLPHIPKFHVDKGSIQILYDTYKEVLPTLDGYLNHEGTIQLERYRKYLQKLAQYDMDLFNGTTVDLKYFNQDLNAITFGDNGDNAPLDDFEFEALPEESTDDDDEESSDEKDDTFDDDDTLEEDIEEEFTVHKNNYYRTKLHFKDLEGEVLNIVNEYIKGVQWVLFYYFNGCVSWNWFYPFYYAPYVSDLSKFDIVDYKFEKSRPFKPLVQLLAVLPHQSKDFLPKACQNLTGGADSALREFYPKNVEIDMNEKIHDYEAIVLIPFIEEEKLLSVYGQYEAQLTEEEMHRNRIGGHYSLKHIDDASQADDPDFPNLKLTLLDQEHFILPPELIFKGVRHNVDLKEIIGFPTLSGIRYRSKLEANARLKVFRFNSQNPSMMITVLPSELTAEQLAEYARAHLGTMVYINWPLLSEAKLLELVSTDKKYYLSSAGGGQSVASDTPSKLDLGYAKQSSASHCSALRNRKGVILDKVGVLAKVVPLQSQRYIITGGRLVLHKEWAKAEQYIPLELVIPSRKGEGAKTVQQQPHRTLKDVFQRGRAFFLLGQPYYGCRGEVLEYLKTRNLVRTRITVAAEPDFEEIKEHCDAILDEHYILEGQLARKLKSTLGVNENAIRRLFGSVIVCYKSAEKGKGSGKERKMNLGLKLKYRSNYEQNIKPHCVPGWSIAEGNELYYNRKLVEVFKEYQAKFGVVFSMLTKQHKSLYEINDLFEDPALDKGEKVKMLSEIRDWLDSLELSKIGHYKSSARNLDNCIVKAIEETIESHSVLMAETYTEEKELPPAHFFTGEFVLKGSTLPDPKVKFYLYDRVVNVRKCIAVPYGAKGTVIGIYGKDDELSNARGGGNSGGDDADTPVKLAARDDEPADAVERLMAAVIEVLFDEPFDGGLKTRSTKANIYKMQAAWLINLTYGVKAGGSGAVGTRSAHFRNSYQPIQQGMMINGYGQQGQGLQPKSSTPKVPVKQHQPPYLLAVKGPPPKFDNVGGGSSAASVAATAALARAGIGRMVFKNPNYYQPKPNHQQQQQPNHQPNYHQQQQLQLLQKFNHSETSPFKILTRAAGVGVAPNNTQANGGGGVHHQQPQQQLPQQQQQPLPPPPVLPPQPLRPTAAVFEPVLPSVGYTGAQISQLLKDMMNINGGVGGTAGLWSLKCALH